MGSSNQPTLKNLPLQGEYALFFIPVRYALQGYIKANHTQTPRDLCNYVLSKDVGIPNESNNNYYVDLPSEGDSPRRDTLVTITTGLSPLVWKMSLKRKGLMLDEEGVVEEGD